MNSLPLSHPRRAALTALTFVAASLLASSPTPLKADDVTWIATAGDTGSWLSAFGWDSGTLPLAGDVAIFNNVGAATLSYSMYHAWNPTPGSGNIGAIWLTANRVTSGLEFITSSAGSDVFNYHGATVNGVENVILQNDSTKNLILRSTSPTPQIRLSTNSTNRVVLTSSGNIAIRTTVTGSGASLEVTSSSTGRLELGGAGSTYSGGTVVKSGTLLITADNAAGTGAIISETGRVEVSASIAFSNEVELKKATAAFQRQFTLNQSYGTLTITGNGDFQTTHAQLTGGNASAANLIEASFSASSAATNDDQRSSAIFNLSTNVRDIYVLELTGEPTGKSLGWLEGDLWKNAVEGNQSTGANAIAGFQGSFAASGTSATIDYLGSWGYDSSTQTAWAIVDHGGAFAVIPEPGAGSMALAGGLILLTGGLWKLRRAER